MRWIVVILLTVSGMVGCGKSTPPEAASPEKGASAAARLPNHPAAEVAHRLMTAIVKGDVDAANKLITPKALQQLQATQQTFVSAEGDTSTFTIDRVEEPGPGEALVQCVTTSDSKRAEMCWVMTQVEGDWRVRGLIAGESTEDEMWVFDFESNSPMTPRKLGNSPPAGPGSQVPQAAMAPGGNPVQ